MNKEYTMTYVNKHISGGDRVEITVSHDDLVYYAKQCLQRLEKVLYKRNGDD